MARQRGLFIAVEGIEGSGKSTLSSAIAESLTLAGIDSLLTKEPGGTELGCKLREILLDPAMRLSYQTETLLFLADRAHHISSLVVPSLESGLNVICDRYFFSTLAYQGYGRGQNLNTLRELVSFAHGGVLPDLVLIVDLPVDVALGRARSRRNEDPTTWNRFEEEQITFHNKVRDGFLELAKLYPAISVVLDGRSDKKSLLESALNKIRGR